MWWTPGPGGQVVILQGLLGRHQQGGSTVADLAGHRRGDPAPFCQGRKGRHLLERCVAPRALVHCQPGDRHDLGVEATFVDGGYRPLVAGQGEVLHRLAGDVPLLGDHLGPGELGRRPGCRSDRPIRSSRGTGFSNPRGSAGGPCVGDGHHGHVLNPTGHHQVVHPGHRRHRREAHGLLSRAALAIDGHPGYGLGEPGRQPAGPGNVAGIGPDVVEVAEDDVLDRGRIDSCALQQSGDRSGPQISGMDVRQGPTSAVR